MNGPATQQEGGKSESERGQGAKYQKLNINFKDSTSLSFWLTSKKVFNIFLP